MTPRGWLCWPTRRHSNARPLSRRWCTGQRGTNGAPHRWPMTRTGRRPFTLWPLLLPVAVILNTLSLPGALRKIEELKQQKHSLVVQVEALLAKLHHPSPTSLREQQAEAEVGHPHFRKVGGSSSFGSSCNSSSSSLSPVVPLVVPPVDS